MDIFIFMFFIIILVNLIVGNGTVTLLIITPMLLMMWCGLSSERKEWNNGICAVSGKPWKRFDTDSQGGRGYTDGAGHYCWISYDIDKNYEHNTV